MNHCVIGFKGEVGNAVYKYLKDRGLNVFGIDIDNSITVSNSDYIHICIPYSNDFIRIVKNYAKNIRHKYIVIYSSVPVGTTEKVGKEAVHSPIEGRHPELYRSFAIFKRLIGGKNAKEIAGFFEEIGLNTEVFKSPKTTELGKLLSTTRYGLNLMFADIEQELCKKHKVNYEEAIIEYQRMYNNGYLNMNEPRFVQQMLIPPNNKIGGHCVVPNARLLFKDIKNPIIGRIAEYG